MNYEEPLFFTVIQYAAGADRDVIDMVSGSPDWEPPTALREGLHEYADADPSEFRYPASQGLRELREEIADRRGVDAEQIVVTNGTCEANYLAMAEALERAAGDEVLLTDPVYPYYPGRVQMLDGSYRFVPVERDGQLDPAAVRERVGEDTAAIVVNTPNNPTGAVYPRETMRELVAIAEEHDAYLVADEVYDHFDYTGAFESALAVDSDRRIVTSGFSKSMAITGWRVGYAVFPEDLVDAAATRHMLINISASRPAMAAVTHALKHTGPDYYAEVREMLESRIDTFTEALAAAGADYTEPDGAFYVMARFEDFPGTMGNVERLIDEAGVAGMPGEAFGEAYEDWIRFALVTPRVQEAADRLAGFFE
ncbi:MAG: pyridoxal phosphate-dependent aminotransferase [Haloferacaceae archaeon]